MRYTHSLLVLLSILALSTPTLPAFAAREIFHEIYEVEAGTILDVHNFDGSITITGGTGDRVDVYAKKTAMSANYFKNINIAVTTGRHMTVRTEHLTKNPRVSVAYTITVPENVIVNEVTSSDGSLTIIGTTGDLQAKSSDGSIRFENIHGIVEVKTSDGSITGKNVTGPVNAKTSDGSLNLNNVTGSVTAKTSDGSIEIEEIHGDVIADSHNGSLTIRHVVGFVDARSYDGSISVKDVSGILDIDTYNGSVVADVSEIRDDAGITSRDGNITLYLASDLNAEVEMRAGDGKIVLHDIEIRTREISSTSLKGTFGDGDHRLEVSTSDGNINVHMLP